jgi:hypothetical protein
VLHIDQPLPLQAGAESLVVVSALIVVECLQKKMGVFDHPLPLTRIGLLVVLEPGGDGSTGQRLFAQGIEQGQGIRLVGARPRQQHPIGRPGG